MQSKSGPSHPDSTPDSDPEAAGDPGGAASADTAGAAAGSAAGSAAPAGFGRRRPRLTDAETERRMLTTAVAELSRTGLTVSLDHLRLEDLIREAGVSRSTVYRRWPHKDLFLADLLLELARAHAPMSTLGSAEMTQLLSATILERFDDLRTPDGRVRLAAEVLRLSAWHDFDHIRRSPQWRTYLALTGAVAGMPPGDLRDRVRQALVDSEREFTDRIAVSHQRVTALLGLRLRPDTGLDFRTIAHLVNGLLRGLIVKAEAAPEVADDRIEGTVGGLAADWSLPGLGAFAVVGAFVEPDPDVDWDDERIDHVRQQVSSTNNLFT